ncbi:hypothetical protein JTE90_009888 [Oedothorax gibbosus]|uniref:Prokineticin domain-containing protein n=1 Tax=Oedothorax gibbosus TaxID=931172 RepID=A0AAV6UV64_9ARAC|nr:hypothetical protein JTE90_009888 [Oedothorax gibbosus]
MKSLAGILLVSLFCVVFVKSEKQFAQKLCRTAEDCDWDQCCIDAITRLPGFKGICSPPTQKGEICNPNTNDMIEGRYRKACPCDSGLTCKHSEKEESLFVCQH